MSSRPAPRSRWRRLLAVLGLLLSLAALTSASAQAAPASPTPTPSASSSPAAPTQYLLDDRNCIGLDGPGLKECRDAYTEVCEKPNAQNLQLCHYVLKTTTSTGNGGKSADCTVLQGAPRTYCTQGATTSGTGGWLGNLTGDCKSPPTPEQPSDGILGWFIKTPTTAPAFLDPTTPGADQHIFEQYGYAGLSWDVYDLGCGGALVRDQNAGVDTWLADKAFTASKFGVGLSNSLHTWVGSNNALTPLDPLITSASQAVGAAVYTPWISVSMLILGCVIVFGARRRDLPGTVTAIGWALLVITLATISLQHPVQTGRFADSAINGTIGQIDAQFNKTPNTTDPGTAQADLMTSSVLYRNWLRGELGDPDSATAHTYGMLLLDSQALTFAQASQPPAAQAQIINAKEAEFRGLASAIQNADPDAYAHLTGHATTRLGASSGAFLATAATTPFTDLGSLIQILAELVIRLVVVFFPILALVGLHRRSSGIVRGGLYTIAAAVINAPLFAVLGGLEILCVRLIMGGGSTSLPEWVQILLLAMITCVLWAVSKPFRKLTAMVAPNRNVIADGLDGITRTRDKVLGGVARGAMGRFSYTNRLLRRYNQGIGAAAGASAGTAPGASGAGAGVPWGPEEEPWQVPAGYTQPRPETAIPSPRGATAAAGAAGAPGRSVVPSPAAADDGPGADPGLDLPLTTGGSYPAASASAASVPEAEGPAWPQEPALETRPAAPAAAASPATTQAAGGAGARASGHSQSPGSGEVPYFQPGADSDAVTTDAGGYRDVDEAPSFTAFRPPEPSPPPAPSTSGSAPHPTPPARPAAPPRPPHTPSAAPTRDTSPGYLPELETGLGDPGRGEDSVYE